MNAMQDTMGDKTRNRISDRAPDADDLKDMANRAGHGLRSMVEDSWDEVVDATRNYKSTVRSHPIQTTLVALATGVVVGMLLRR